MFGRKQAQIKQLEEALDDQKRLYEIAMKGWRATEASELKLMGQIREMDQLIFRMSQAPNWELMRPIFLELCEPSAKRQRAESDRITTLLIPEMQKAYR